MRLLSAVHVDYWTRPKWICDGLEHEHLSEAAAQRCEDNPRATRKGKLRDGTYARAHSGALTI